MKIILSKKGFDTKYGGYPSIIDGATLISMPIPDNGERYTYGELKTEDGASLFEKVKPYYRNIYIDGNSQPFTHDVKCHPDPDLTNYFGTDNFRGSIGQVNQAQAHLFNKGNGIQSGDIFLFYGYYAEIKNGKLPKSKGKNVIFGYLQIESIINVNTLTTADRITLENIYPFLKKQPHWNLNNNKNNIIFVAAENLSLDTSLKGYGTFVYDKELDLTKPNSAILRDWCVPSLSGLSISGNGEGARFDVDGSFKVTATYGQEFVIEESDKAIKWAENLIKKYAKR